MTRMGTVAGADARRISMMLSRIGRAVAGAVLALACATSALVAAMPAYAAVSDHTVSTESPSGTTVNLFDYWTVAGDNDNSANINGTAGINKGHTLQFNNGKGTGINCWTGGSTPYAGMVGKSLVNGFPQLTNGESLSYLFDTTTQAGKAAHNGVLGLLQRDSKGYYCYDSTQNYAAYDAGTNSFKVFDAWGVKDDSAGKSDGQFFPFNTGDTVFVERWGQLSQKDVYASDNSALNHHFGMTMETRFAQPTGGVVSYKGKSEDMTYEFAGDDDVWVYIDNVLVGDLGGIHNAASLSINFRTGAVSVNGKSAGTLKSIFAAAGVDTGEFSGNTFKDGSNHTLKFFYLERGAGASNLKLKFNLYNQPSSDVNKTDQNGLPVGGATFALYEADENYNVSGDALAEGTTSGDGKLVLTKKSDGTIVSFDDEAAAGITHFVLREASLPDGYHTSLTARDGELHLEYVTSKHEGVTGGSLTSPEQTMTVDGKEISLSRMWVNGSYISAKETMTAHSTVHRYDSDTETVDVAKGITFAVVFKNTTPGNNDIEGWKPIKGGDQAGYQLCDAAGKLGAIEAIKATGGTGVSTVLTRNSMGQLELEMTELPGDVTSYAYMMSQKDVDAGRAEYVVAVYHSDATTIEGITDANTVRLNENDFDRKYSSRMHVTNIQNRLWVQKVDEAGNPLSGATFALYSSDSVTGTSAGAYKIKAGAQPIDTAETSDRGGVYNMAGSACFPVDSQNHTALTPGVYFLAELSAPNGYAVNSTLTKVIVDKTGVYVDAGLANDGVESMSGPGSLLYALQQFGSNTQLDNTLTKIRGSIQSASEADDGALTWSAPAADARSVTMRYGADASASGRVLDYVVDGKQGDFEDGDSPILFNDTGINRMALYQNGVPDNGTDLSGLQVNQLFTTATGVRYTDRGLARLQVTKSVRAAEGLTAPADARFSFRFELPQNENGYEALVFNADGTTAGDSFMLKNGDVHTITAGQTIRVYGLKKGDSYKVEELTTNAQAAWGNPLAMLGSLVTLSADQSALPAGFALTDRLVGGIAQAGEGNAIEGTIAAMDGDDVPASNTLEFVNTYSAEPAHVTDDAETGFWAQKTLEGRDWKDDDTFTLRLYAAGETPMPDGAVSVGSGSYIDKQVDNGNRDEHVFFGDIAYTKPGSYSYTVSEVLPDEDSQIEGISYSAATYRVTVKVVDDGAGSLKIDSVTMTRQTDDAGAAVDRDDATVDDRVAAFTNTYNTHKGAAALRVVKSYSDTTGANPLAAGMFSFAVEPQGGFDVADAKMTLNGWDTAIAAPMPDDATTLVAKNDESGLVAFPQISYSAKKNAGHAYVYKITEQNEGAAGMSYDGSVYYALVRCAWHGRGIEVHCEYYKLNATGTGLSYLGHDDAKPVFSNSYTASAVTSAPLNGQKTLVGRNWSAGETFRFNLSGADDVTRAAITAGTVSLPGTEAVAKAPAEGWAAGEPIAFAFGAAADAGDTAAAQAEDEADASNTSADAVVVTQTSAERLNEVLDNVSASRANADGATGVTFAKPGTYVFAVNESTVSTEDAGITYDRHASTVTYEVVDTDESGNHVGALRIAKVTYDNGAATGTDRDYTDRVAFTNTYHATGSFAGVDVTKTMTGRALAANDFSFDITGLSYNGYTTLVPADMAHLGNPAAKKNEAAHLTYNKKMLFAQDFTEQELGHVYAYRIGEDKSFAQAGVSYDTSYTGDAIVLVEPYVSDSDPGTIQTLVTVLKGQAAIDLLDESGDASVFTGQKIAELMADPTVYAKQFDTAKSDATPVLGFVNEYSATLDYGAAGGLQLVKTVKRVGDNLGSPSGDFQVKVTPCDSLDEDGKVITTASHAAERIGIDVGGQTVNTGRIDGYVSKSVSLIHNNRLKFTQEDDGRVFTYQFQELQGSTPGFSYDQTVYTVRIAVVDNGDGTLTATTTVSAPDADGQTKVLGTYKYTSGKTAADAAIVPITNTYKVEAGDDSTITPAAIKLVTGRDTEDEFSFDFYTDDAATQAAIDDGAIAGSGLSAKNSYRTSKSTHGRIADGETQKVSFAKMTFHKVGTYTFKLAEDVPESQELGGWTYDKHVHAVTVVVTDEGGKLVAEHSDDGDETNVFTNSWSTSTSYAAQGGMSIVKTLTGRQQRAGEFSFEVIPNSDSAIAKSGADPIVAKTSAPDAQNVTRSTPLNTLTFSTADEAQAFEYVIHEKSSKAAGITTDSSWYTVTITPLSADGGQTLYTETVVQKYASDPRVEGAQAVGDPSEYSSRDGAVTAQVAFANTYNATGTAAIKAGKVMTGNDVQTGAYRFIVSVTNDAGGSVVVNEATVSAGKDNDADHPASIDFGKLELSLDGAMTKGHLNLLQAVEKGCATRTVRSDGTAVYTIRARVSEDVTRLPAGVRPSVEDPSYIVTLTVVDDGSGKLTSSVAYPTDDNKLTFTNVQDKIKTVGTVEKPSVDIDGQLLSVDDEYVYTINWFNNATDDSGSFVPADVTVTDALPAGTELVEDGTTTGYVLGDSGELIWKLPSRAAGAYGRIRICVRITGDAQVNEGDTVGTIQNTASIVVGDHEAYTGTTTNYTPKKTLEGLEHFEGGMVSLDQELTYTVGYKNTAKTASTVYVYDTIPAGTAYIEGSASDGGTLVDGRLVWKLDNVAAGSMGTVSFKVRVMEDAFRDEGSAVTNRASVKIGEDGPEIKTDEVEAPVNEGLLMVSKAVYADDGLTAPDKKFKFTLHLSDGEGNALTGWYAYTLYAADGVAEGYLTDGAEFELGDGDMILMPTIPGGAHYSVKEEDAGKDGFTLLPDEWQYGDTNPRAGYMGTAGFDIVPFENQYSVESATLSGKDAFAVEKKLSGRDWKSDDSFTFSLSADEGTPLPQDKDGNPQTTLTLDADHRTGHFGDIVYSTPGNYSYYIEEKNAGADGIVYSVARYRVDVTVADRGDGTLEVTHSMTRERGDSGESSSASASVAVFTNTYRTPKTIASAAAPKTNINGKLLSVGDEYTYTISWVNNALDDSGVPAAADVRVSDTLPAGVEFVSAGQDGAYDEATRTVGWDLGSQDALATGEVSVRVRITDDAATMDNVTNTASITVGDHAAYTGTTVNYVPKKEVSGTAEDGSAKVGDKLTYTIQYRNTEKDAASVRVTDTVPAGCELVDAGGATQDGDRLTWHIDNVDAGATGTVSFTARVTAAALSQEGMTVSNTARVKVANNPEVNTNAVKTQVKTGSLVISKAVEGRGADESTPKFTFTVTLRDAGGNALSGTFGGVAFDASGKATLKLGRDESAELTGLPEGATYTVVEDPTSGYTASVNGTAGATATGTIAADAEQRADYTNTYGYVETLPVKTNGLFTKTLTGRSWWASDAFDFTMTQDAANPVGGAIIPNDGKVTVRMPVDHSDKTAFGFGDITITKPGTYVFYVNEVVNADGSTNVQNVAGDTHTATLKVTVRDNGDGTMSTVSAATVENGGFTNAYHVSLDYTQAGGLWLQKTLNGRDMKAGQFAFTVKPVDEDSAELLGISKKDGATVEAPASAAGTPCTPVDLLLGRDIVFDETDVGKTFTFRVTETKKGGAGYTNDADPREVKIIVTADGGALSADTFVTHIHEDGSTESEGAFSYMDGWSSGRAMVSFVNSYAATGTLGGDGDVAINASKTIVGRELEEGEFRFEVVDTATGDVKATGTNDVSGKIAFSGITYTQDDCGTHVYTVREVTDDLPTGVTPVVSEFAITVEVRDNGDGTLDIKVNYPKSSDDALAFKNRYGADAAVELPMSGQKFYTVPEGSGYNPPSIDGKFTFTLTGEGDAPMPQGSDGRVKTVRNSAGAVDFGSIEYTMENVFGAASASDDDGESGAAQASAQRSRTFTYTVAETAGEVAGVTRDTAVKTIEVTVTDNGDGTLSVAAADATDGAHTVLDPSAFKFAFTNAYAVEPVSNSITADGGVSVTKELDGRALSAGDFSFELLDAQGSVLQTKQNDAAGTISFDAITYTQPGAYAYTLREVVGTDGDKGITYDRSTYQVRVTVTDDGAGKLVAKTELLDAEGVPSDKNAVTFKNSYEAAPATAQIVAAKVLEGATLKDGQFSFVLKNREGKTVQTVKNAADGSVTFDPITFKQAGTYTYTVSEANDGQSGVTYDTSVKTLKVVVTDAGTGALEASIETSDDLVFTNTYRGGGAPSGPGKPGSSGSGGGMPRTGDANAAPELLAFVAVVGAAAVVGGSLMRRRA